MVKLKILLFECSKLDAFLFKECTKEFCDIDLIKCKFDMNNIDVSKYDFVFIDLNFTNCQSRALKLIDELGLDKENTFLMSGEIEDIISDKDHKFGIVLFTKKNCFEKISSFLKKAHKRKIYDKLG